RTLRHERQRLAMVLGLVPSRLFPGAGSAWCREKPERARRRLRSAGTRPPETRPERRFVRMQRPILRALLGRQPRQRRSGQRRLEHWIPHGQIGFINRDGRFVALYEAKTIVSDKYNCWFCWSDLHLRQLANTIASRWYKSRFGPCLKKRTETDFAEKQSEDKRVLNCAGRQSDRKENNGR